MRGIEARIEKLEQAGNGRTAIVCSWVYNSEAEVQRRVTELAKAERIPERNIIVIRCPWLEDRGLEKKK